MNYFIFILLVVGIFTGKSLFGQNDTILNYYIHLGLKHNRELRDRKLDYRLALEEHRAARGKYLPQVGLNARYSVARGGRTIDLPIRDLFAGYNQYNNFVHQNIGLQLGLPEQIQNEEIYFMRRTEHDTKVSLLQAVYDARVIKNIKLQEKIARVNETGIKHTETGLISDIRKGWYNYLKAVETNNLLIETEQLLLENLRVNKKLHENSKVTMDKVYRSESELSKLQQHQAESEKAVNTARAWFNFLIGRGLTEKILEPDSINVNLQFPSVESVMATTLENNPGIKMKEMMVKVAKENIKLSNAYYYPYLYGAVDYGFQGVDYRFTSEDDYVLASLVLKWDLFTGMQNDVKKQKSLVERQKAENKYDESVEMIKLAVIDAWYGLKAGQEALKAAGAREKASARAFKVVEKAYEQGSANYLEFMDARNSLTGASQNLIVKKYDFLIKFAELQEIMGISDFSK
ncbi:MAG: TolC family protein [Bacteroidales bacterium]